MPRDSGKRKDNRGRVLPPNVSQKSDKRYIWRKMIDGKSYVLTDNDLNELKKRIVERESEILNGIYSKNPKITLNEWFDKWIVVYKGNVKHSTRYVYSRHWENYVRYSEIGQMRLDKVKRIHIVELYRELLGEKDLSTSTVKTVHIILRGSLQDAFCDGYIRDNPASKAFSKVEKKEPNVREPLTERQQYLFIEFIKQSNVYKVHLPLFSLFLGTGVRLGEMAGLTWKDVDLEKGYISINHAMHYSNINGKMTYNVSEPKTESGTRDIPLVMELRKQLLKKKEYDRIIGCYGSEIVDGYTDFVFHTASGKPYTHASVNSIIRRIVNAHNTRETKKAIKENREPELLPMFSAHVLRHTFCTRFCENESNVKVIQEIMGHKDIQTTLNIYSHVTKEKATTVMQDLGRKIKIS